LYSIVIIITEKTAHINSFSLFFLLFNNWGSSFGTSSSSGGTATASGRHRDFLLFAILDESCDRLTIHNLEEGIKGGFIRGDTGGLHEGFNFFSSWGALA